MTFTSTRTAVWPGPEVPRSRGPEVRGRGSLAGPMFACHRVRPLAGREFFLFDINSYVFIKLLFPWNSHAAFGGVRGDDFKAALF